MYTYIHTHTHNAYLINATLVRQKVLENSEGALNRPIRLNLLHDALARHRVDSLAVITRLSLLSAHALRGRLGRAARLVVSAVDVVLAGGESVWVTVFGDEAVAFEEVPCAGGEATCICACVCIVD